MDCRKDRPCFRTNLSKLNVKFLANRPSLQPDFQFPPIYRFVKLLKKTQTWTFVQVDLHLTLLKMLMRTRKSVTSIAILKVRVKLLRHASTSKKILWKIANERAVPFTLKMKLFGFWINAAVIWEFLDQCSCYLGKAFSLFGWLCFDRYWQQNWKLATEPTFKKSPSSRRD